MSKPSEYPDTTLVQYKNGGHAYYDSNHCLHSPEKHVPAVTIHEDDTQSIMYYWHGKLHRTDGPAIVVTKPNGNDPIIKWYINGDEILKDVDLSQYFADVANPTDEELVAFKIENPDLL